MPRPVRPRPVSSAHTALRTTPGASAGFTLIELMIVVAIVGLLAAILTPAYQDYTTRARVAEAIMYGATGRNAVTEYFSAYNQLPDTNQQAGLDDPARYTTDVVASMTVATGGVVRVAVRVGLVPAVIAGSDVVEFRPDASDGSGRLSWACAGGGTTLPKRYLPSQCR